MNCIDSSHSASDQGQGTTMVDFPPFDEPAGNGRARTETATRVLEAARKILSEPGHTTEREDWARSILQTNALFGGSK